MGNTKKSQSDKLLYPAMQKFYNALNNLEKFNKGSNFFDNISCLDSFFSEYRSVTFVLQKSLANTECFHIYETNRDKYLKSDNGTWFLKKRNEVSHEHPFYLEKRMLITVYLPQTSIALPTQIFNIENDVEYSTQIESLKLYFKGINNVEVFFSVEFSFYEKDVDIELYENLIEGIDKMKEFLKAMKEDLNEECNLCSQLEQKINKLNFYKVPKNILFIEDFVYYCKDDTFEKSMRIELVGVLPKGIKQNISGFKNYKTEYFGEIENDFMKFIIMHTVIFEKQKSLLPTFMIVYEDDTFDLMSFQGSVKTTTYRKINEIAKRIEHDNIKIVFYVTEMVIYELPLNNSMDFFNMKYTERVKHQTKELLCFFKLNSSLEYQSFAFESEKVGNYEYIAYVIKNEANKFKKMNFLKPIMNEFMRLSNIK